MMRGIDTSCFNVRWKTGVSLGIRFFVSCLSDFLTRLKEVQDFPDEFDGAVCIVNVSP